MQSWDCQECEDSAAADSQRSGSEAKNGPLILQSMRSHYARRVVSTISSYVHRVPTEAHISADYQMTRWSMYAQAYAVRMLQNGKGRREKARDWREVCNDVTVETARATFGWQIR